ncbi:MAG: cysteine desulfurase [Clostridia bacterium]|nr:cysteine desulfurase [Clostridia bacterium]
MIYLDHAATTKPDDRVIAAMSACMAEAWANPSAPYAAAGAARRELRLARRVVAGMLNARAEEIAFTSGGSEANSHAMTLAAGGHAVVSAVEHASVLNAARHWAGEVTRVMPDKDGVVRPEAVEAALKPDTRLISVQLVNNETGVVQPVLEIGALARARRVPFHCDAVQAFGQVPVDVRAMGIDLLSLSAHKLCGPRGAGALFVRQGVDLKPLIDGGGQEFGLRAGTENVSGICGLRVAAELARDDMAARAERERALIDRFVANLREKIPGCMPLCRGAERAPGIVAVLLPGVDSERAVAALDLRGVAVSGGAACASREHKPSHVYRALGLSEKDAACVIRVSVGRHTTAEEINEAAEIIAQVCR